jgi:hypothetical protein
MQVVNHYDHCMAKVPPILTHGWLPPSLNLWWRRDHTVLNPSSQDTDAEPQTLMASSIALRFEEQVPVSTDRDRSRTTSTVRLSPITPLSVTSSSPSPFTQNTLQPLSNNLRGRVVWQPCTGW